MSFRFDHIAQQVPNIAEAVAWYQETIPGTTILFQDSSWAFIEANGAKLAFVLKDQHPGHLAWRVTDSELEELAVRWDRPISVHRDKTRSFYLEAPGSQWIEIICTVGSIWEDKSDNLSSNE